MNNNDDNGQFPGYTNKVRTNCPGVVMRNQGTQGSRAMQSGVSLKSWMASLFTLKNINVISLSEYNRIKQNPIQYAALCGRPFAICNFPIKSPTNGANFIIEQFRAYYAIRIPSQYGIGGGRWYIIHGQRQTTSGSADKKLDYFINVMKEFCRRQRDKTVAFTMVVHFENEMFGKLAPAVGHHQAKLPSEAKLLFSFAFETWLTHILA